MRRWLKETHGPGFELLRHFLRRFFESESITATGEMVPLLIAAVPVMLQWFLLLITPLRHKYGYFNHLATPGPYREAVRADELWLITLMMSTIGLLTAFKWPTLFPDPRDYRVLGTLPLRPRQIFGAKLAALLLVASGVAITVNFLPSVGFPALSTSHWALQTALGTRVIAHAAASFAACGFFLFGMVALQGVLLNVLRPRAFGRVTGSLQGLLVGLMLGLIVLSFSIEPRITGVLVRPEWGRWLPPVWFLGLYQKLAGDPDPEMLALASRAAYGLGTVVGLALLSYVVSYHRHRTLLMEGASGGAKRGRLGGVLLNCVSRRPRQQAVIAFMMQTLGRSNHHRMILMGYGGLGFAVLLTGVAAMGSVFTPTRVMAADFVYYHILALLFLIIGARHLFSLPTELKSNWIFQIMEGDGRVEWCHAVDRFVLFYGAAPLLLLPLAVEVRLLGWRGIEEASLFLVLGLLVYDWVFLAWNKLPFTCSHLPGKTPVGVVLASLGLLGAVGLAHSLLMAILDSSTFFLVVLVLMGAAWVRVHRNRRENWDEVRLKYEEAPEVAVEGLNLLKG